MQRAIWIVAAIVFLLWSLFAWLGYAMLGWVGDFTASNAGQLAGAEMADFLVWAAGVIGATGGTLIVIVWIIGGAVIGVVAALLAKLASGSRQPHRADRFQRFPPSHR